MKKSFTLIELLIAIAILSFLAVVMNKLIIDLKKQAQILKKIEKRDNQKELLLKTLYNDILNATDIKIVHSFNSNYDRLYLQTSNTLYNLIYSYVIWYVSKKSNTLIRIESPFKITLPTEDAFYLDKFTRGVKIFKIFRKNGKDLIFIEAKKPIYFEMVDKDFKSQ
jgi:prepilin-type N-terminal cleavage/methylation domain-containing protein